MDQYLRFWIVIALTVMFQNVQSMASEDNENILVLRSQELQEKIATMNLTNLENSAKALIAQYLLATAIEEQMKAREQPEPYGGHKHHTKPISSGHFDNRNIYDRPVDPINNVNNNNRVQSVESVLGAIVSSPTQSSSSSGGVIVPSYPAPVQQQTPNQPIVAPPSPARQDTATVIPIITNTVQPVPAVVTPGQVPVQQAQGPVPAPAAPVTPTTPTIPTTPRPTVDPVHHINQVDKILGNVANGNIVGIVDESLAIRAPTPVRNLVTGILKVVFCNPLDRLFGRCNPNRGAGISTAQG